MSKRKVKKQNGKTDTRICMYIQAVKYIHNHSNSIEKLSKYFHSGQPHLVAVIITNIVCINGTNSLNYLHKSIVQNGLL